MISEFSKPSLISQGKEAGQCQIKDCPATFLATDRTMLLRGRMGGIKNYLLHPHEPAVTQERGPTILPTTPE